MNQRKNWRLAFCAAMLMLLVGLCNGDEGGPLKHVDDLQCGTLVVTCSPSNRYTIVGVKDLGQNVDNSIRSYWYWDCALEQWIHAECNATCTVVIQ